ncbi:unnamed protein product [Vitrella brassicaformis CCMP3155]|uniref:Pre-mRNA-splicing factor Syf1/CRNKL1-like C-terminal HAT-repeats domain-containing protein n=2 Tax=Vitrella brassicaformis TaxID=1169539 RepID=A0A0G4GR91_VITBC|nr:unnamed protein product [Vitrella brassicaformis CCMP3155]|eukprot:CEM33045.1 unnamed protein product [Vitrella brassicaformis CCMP3155]
MDEDEGRGRRGPRTSMGKQAAVKNKTPAPIQITAEQLLREAVDRQGEEARRPRQRIVDDDELAEYRIRKRKEFEDTLRRQRHHIGSWIKYATWEAAQKEFRRARSVFERALNVEYTNVGLWVKYIEMETKNKFINSARNLYDRVTNLLPREDQFWFKYAHMEELLGNYAGARTIYDRWMEWNPDEKGWMLYIKFEERCGEIERCRRIFENFLSNRPSEASFLKLCKFEEKHRNYDRARAGFEKAIEILGDDALGEQFYIKFAQFEHRRRENERATMIYKQALNILPKGESEELYRSYVAFQKQHGAKNAIEETILEKRRFVYEDAIKKNPRNYDNWFDYVRLEESAGDVERIREVYERAVANLPPAPEKRFWKRYIYLWLYYALFEEMQTGDMEKARQVYRKALDLVPHQSFSFAKLWTLFAEFEVRQLNIDRARKIYGEAIARCGKEKIFEKYAALELQLGNIDRCRKIYAQFVSMQPHNPKAWTAFVELETAAEEHDRARGLCELAIRQEVMDRPELVWKCYIDMETTLGELERARRLYEQLLEKTQHFKVYRGYSEFEYRHAGSMEKARQVIQKGLEHCRDNQLDEERAMLLEHWLSLERENGDAKMVDEVFRKQPKKVRKKRNIVADDGTAQGYEEYISYIFPEDDSSAANMRILEVARAWKRKKAQEEAGQAAAT